MKFIVDLLVFEGSMRVGRPLQGLLGYLIFPLIWSVLEALMIFDLAINIS